ncbi:MAG TPA: DnaB-like helicase C-terminal domain-containing protein [Gemmatimonadaceae bacterium]|nr:DnaB-like helicase C-terminal domain-containing protein [Gemmatimonadaceae bacterium]
MPRTTDISPLARLLDRADQAAEGAAAPAGVATGFPTLDRMLGGGLRRGDLVVLAGDTASGKSALALAMALRASEAGHPSHLLSAEMTPERVLERALAIEGRVRVDDLRRGALEAAERGSVGAAALRLRDRVPGVEMLGCGGVESLADALRRALDVELAVVDSLPALATGARDRDEELATAARTLKALALELDVALLVTTPLAASVAGRPDPRPRLDDLGALGALKHHADVVLGLFREEMYQPDPGDRSLAGATELLVLKNRNGPTGYVDLYFYERWLRFEDMVDPDR